MEPDSAQLEKKNPDPNPADKKSTDPTVSGSSSLSSVQSSLVERNIDKQTDAKQVVHKSEAIDRKEGNEK